VGEVAGVAEWLNKRGQMADLGVKDWYFRSATLLQQQEAELAALRGVPVVVCDRPPEEGDCDAEGNVSFTHWLPAHALPLPVFDEEEKSQLVYELPSNL
jgi:hypothetical protein